MKKQAKQLYEKMVDFKRFAVSLLAIGVFFYLGVIIPSDTKNLMDQNIMMITSTLCMAFSILFFIQSKQSLTKLLELEEGEEYIMKK